MSSIDIHACDPHLDYQADNFTEERGRPQCMDKTKRRSINDSVRLTVAVRHEFSRRYCCCAYEINKTTGKRKESRTNDHCEKYEKHIYQSCFQPFHIQSALCSYHIIVFLSFIIF